MMFNREDYVEKITNGVRVLSPSKYDGKSYILFLTAFFEMFVPDKNTYKLPLSVILDPVEEYVLEKEVVKKWKKSYLLTGSFLCVMMAVIMGLLIFILVEKADFKSPFTWGVSVGCCVVVTFLLLMIRELVTEYNKTKKYRMI